MGCSIDVLTNVSTSWLHHYTRTRDAQVRGMIATVSDMTKRSVPGIRAVLDDVRAAAVTRGVEFDKRMEDVARRLVNSRVESAAAQMGVTPGSWMTAYGDLLKPDEILNIMLEAKAQHDQDMSGDPIRLSLHDAGRVIASLGQAARMVSLNFADSDSPLDSDAEAVLDGAGNGTSSIALALCAAAKTGAVESIVIDGEGVGLARQALTTVIEKFRTRDWTAGNERIDFAVLHGMMEDLSLLDA